MSKWHRTSQKPPKEGEDVLCCWIVANRPPLMGVATYARPERWHEPEDDEDDYRAPEWWMPLPSAPKSLE